jgi:hypothetical protein
MVPTPSGASFRRTPLVTVAAVTTWCGLTAAALGLALPWLSVSLQPGLSPLHLQVRVPGVGIPSWFTYGAVLVGCLGLATLGLVRSRGQPTAITSTAGIAVILASLLFWASAAWSDLRLTDLLTRRTAELRMIRQQFGYRIPSSRLTAIGFIPLTGRWRVVGDALQPGWLLALAGGVLLLIGGRRSLAGASRRRPWIAGTGVFVVAGVIAILLGRGFMGNQVARSAFTAGHAGDYRLEVKRFQRAEELNPTLRLRADIAHAIGYAENLRGQTLLPQALEARANLDKAAARNDLAVEEIAAAHLADPNNSVISDEYRAIAVSVAAHENRAALLLPLLHQPTVDALPIRYTLGRVLYATRRYDDAIVQLGWVTTHSLDRNVISSALTYIALCQKGKGDERAARATLIRAIAMDTGYANFTARDLAAGLFTAVSK